MNDLEFELYLAWKNGKTSIVWPLIKFIDLRDIPHVGNEEINDWDLHNECPSPMHEIDIITNLSILETGHFATYRNTLKILIQEIIDFSSLKNSINNLYINKKT